METWELKFKEGVDPGDLRHITPNCAILFLAVLKYFQDENLEMVVTSLISDRVNVQAVSRTHDTGRAFDVRTRHLTDAQIEDVVEYFSHEYSNIGAISSRDYKPAPVVYHNHHFHFQVRPHGS